MTPESDVNMTNCLVLVDVVGIAFTCWEDTELFGTLGGDISEVGYSRFV
jgi:hypothetical protein